MDALGLDRAILPRVLRIERGHGHDHGGGRGADGTEGRARRWWAAAATRRRARWATASWKRGSSPARWARRGVVFAHMEKVAYDPGGPRPHVLPRGARQVARDGRDAGRGAELAVVPQSTGAGRGVRRADRGGGDIAGGRAGTVLAALPDGRAHAAPGRHDPRRLDRADGAATRAPT